MPSDIAHAEAYNFFGEKQATQHQDRKSTKDMQYLAFNIEINIANH